MARPRPRPRSAAPDAHEMGAGMGAHDDASAGLDDPRLARAVDEWHALLDSNGASYEDQAATARACAKVWSIRAELLAQRNEHDPARKAASTASEASSLAAKLDQAAIVDRVAALERILSQSRADATRLAQLK